MKTLLSRAKTILADIDPYIAFQMFEEIKADNQRNTRTTAIHQIRSCLKRNQQAWLHRNGDSFRCEGKQIPDLPLVGMFTNADEIKVF